MEKNALLAAALSYVRERKWSVIPINPSTKRPLVKWKEFTHRLPTDDEIKDWCVPRHGRRPDLAVVTGRISGVAVVDIDVGRGGDAEKWLAQRPTSLVTDTRRGGVHCWYSIPRDGSVLVRNSVDTIGPGIDVRGEGGYVLAPPSEGYKWRSDGDMSSWHDLEVPPHEFRDRITSSEHWIERALRGVGHGERNHVCARLAGYFISKGSPPDVVTQQLIAWNRLNDPPLPDSEIRTTVDSVARTARDRFRVTPRLDEEGEDSGYSLVDLATYICKYGQTKVTWLVDRWLPNETVGMVVAPPGSYKTWLLQDLALSVAGGFPFLGQFEVKNPGPVLFMQQEDWHGQIAHRFALIASRRISLKEPSLEGDILSFQAPPKIPVHLHEHRRFRFDDEEIIQSWVEKVRAIRPRLVILDPLYSAGSVDDFMAGTARSMFLFKSIRDAVGSSFLIAHHTRKQSRQNGNGKAVRGSDAPEREDVWGSQFLNAWIETGWQVRRREELGSATIVRHFKVQSEAPRATVSFHIDTTQRIGKYEVGVKEHLPNEGEPRTEEGDLVRLMEVHGRMSVVRFVEMTGLARASVYRRLENLLKAKVVEKVGNYYELTEKMDT